MWLDSQDGLPPSFCAECSLAQEPAKSESNGASADPDNKNVRVTRFVIAPHKEISLPALDKEASSFVCAEIP
jgi:hypothetical protein